MHYIFIHFHFSANDNFTLILQDVNCVTRYRKMYGMSTSLTDSSSPQRRHFVLSFNPDALRPISITGPNNVPHFLQTRV